MEAQIVKAKEHGLIQSFELQARVENSRPDAIVTLRNGRTIVIDSKATTMMVKGRDRKNYTDNLKRKMQNLAKKNYSKKVGQSAYDMVWMFLPYDRDLQLGYSGYDFSSDEYGVQAYAQKRNILLITPESFLCSLRFLDLLGTGTDNDGRA